MQFCNLFPALHSTPTPNPRTLQAGEKMPHPSHIPDHMPAFPDPHTYIRTLVSNTCTIQLYYYCFTKGGNFNSENY